MPLVKGTHSGVDGVYDADPRHVPTAKKYDQVGYMEVATKDLKVMDATAIACSAATTRSPSWCSTCRRPAPQSILRGEPVGTIVHDV